MSDRHQTTDTSNEAVERLAALLDDVRNSSAWNREGAATLRALLARAERAEAARAEAIARMSDMARQAGSWQGIAEGKDIVIRQLEAERDAAREAADLTWFWAIVDRDGLTGLPSCERAALSALVSRAAEVAALVAAARREGAAGEREACAQVAVGHQEAAGSWLRVADSYGGPPSSGRPRWQARSDTAGDIAAAIRARGGA